MSVAVDLTSGEAFGCESLTLPESTSSSTFFNCSCCILGTSSVLVSSVSGTLLGKSSVHGTVNKTSPAFSKLAAVLSPPSLLDFRLALGVCLGVTAGLGFGLDLAEDAGLGDALELAPVLGFGLDLEEDGALGDALELAPELGFGLDLAEDGALGDALELAPVLGFGLDLEEDGGLGDVLELAPVLGFGLDLAEDGELGDDLELAAELGFKELAPLGLGDCFTVDDFEVKSAFLAPAFTDVWGLVLGAGDLGDGFLVPEIAKLFQFLAYRNIIEAQR